MYNHRLKITESDYNILESRFQDYIKESKAEVESYIKNAKGLNFTKERITSGVFWMLYSYWNNDRKNNYNNYFFFRRIMSELTDNQIVSALGEVLKSNGDLLHE